MKHSRIAILAAGAALIIAAPPCLAGGLRDFGDWTVGCDNTNFCRAVGFNTGMGEKRSPYLVIDRAAGPGGRMRLAHVGDGRTVFVDGKLVATVPEGASRLDTDNPENAGLFDVVLVRKILEAAANGETLAFEDKPEKQDTISLKGLKATLLFMDEQQGRAGTRSAFIARGDKPESETPEPPAIPILEKLDLPKAEDAPAHIEKAVIEFHRKTADRNECSNMEAGIEPGVLTAARIGGGRWLVEIDCWRAAYQAGTVLYVADTGPALRVTPAPVASFETKTAKVTAKPMRSIMSAEFQTAAEISEFAKGRGVGDCGTSASWRWDGKAYRLASYKIMHICAQVQEEDWITLWRTRAK